MEFLSPESNKEIVIYEGDIVELRWKDGSTSSYLATKLDWVGSDRCALVSLKGDGTVATQSKESFKALSKYISSFSPSVVVGVKVYSKEKYAIKLVEL